MRCKFLSKEKKKANQYFCVLRQYYINPQTFCKNCSYYDENDNKNEEN